MHGSQKLVKAKLEKKKELYRKVKRTNLTLE